jgi:hypothetical protein
MRNMGLSWMRRLQLSGAGEKMTPVKGRAAATPDGDRVALACRIGGTGARDRDRASHVHVGRGDDEAVKRSMDRRSVAA